MSELANGEGEPIIGAGTDKELKAAERLAEQYGGNPEDWAKVTSSNHQHDSGYNQETHAYENKALNLVVEEKTKIEGH